MKIRLSTKKDLPAIMKAIKHGRMIQKQNNNQWSDDYPNETVILNDIKNQQGYVVESNQTIIGTFCLMSQPEPTYAKIDGAWLNDYPYATIHRLASTGVVKGVADEVFNYAKTHFKQIRVDTHADNLIMRHIIIKKHDFIYCGIIQVADGTDRLAYHYSAFG